MGQRGRGSTNIGLRPLGVAARILTGSARPAPDLLIRNKCDRPDRFSSGSEPCQADPGLRYTHTHTLFPRLHVALKSTEKVEEGKPHPQALQLSGAVLAAMRVAALITALLVPNVLVEVVAAVDAAVHVAVLIAVLIAVLVAMHVAAVIAALLVRKELKT